MRGPSNYMSLPVNHPSMVTGRGTPTGAGGGGPPFAGAANGLAGIDKNSITSRPYTQSGDRFSRIPI